MSNIDELLSKNKEELTSKLRTASIQCYSGIRMVKKVVIYDLNYKILADHISFTNNHNYDNVARLIKDTYKLSDTYYCDEYVIYQEFVKFLKEDFDIVMMCVLNTVLNNKNDVYDSALHHYDFYAMGILMYLVETIIQGKNVSFNALEMYKKHVDSFEKLISELYEKYKN